jgi:hypothetical protein
MIPVLLLDGILGVHIYIPKPKDIKIPNFSTEIPCIATVEKSMHTKGFRYKKCAHPIVGTGNVFQNPY